MQDEKTKGGDQMKSLLGRVGVILIVLTIFSYAEVWGEDWKFYGSTENFLAYYDAQNITRLSENVVRVWTKSDYTEKGVLNWVKNIGKKYENMNHSKILSEINCAEKTINNLSFTVYDNKGDVIISSHSSSELRFIIPDSVMDGLYQAVCK